MAKQKEETKQAKTFEERPPILSTSITQSKDRRWVIHTVTIKTIKATNYYRKILDKGE